MNVRKTLLDGVEMWVGGAHDARVFLVQPMDGHDLAALKEELSLIGASSPVPFAFAAFRIASWNDQLSPWPAPPVFGTEAFGGKAEETLAWVCGRLLPYLGSPRTVLLGGYSLAGLFALWAGCRVPAFSGIMAASPSVWFPGFVDYARSHKPLASSVYLSLGVKEERTRNRTMARVGDAVRLLAGEYRDQGVPSVLEWNPGGHFQPSGPRCAKGFLWLLDRLAPLS